MRRLLVLTVVLAAALPQRSEGGSAPDYETQVAPIFKAYCAGCHNDEDREGKFSLESFASLQKGTEHGPALLPGDSAGSLMIRLVSGGGKPKMPPKGETRPREDEIALVRAWIDAGAHGPKGQETERLKLVVPKVAASAKPRPIVALDASRDGKWLAVSRDSEVTLYETASQPSALDDSPHRAFGSFPGKVTALHFTPDGTRLVTASGVGGLGGVAAIWNVADGSLIRRFAGHRDILHDAELSPNGRILATCGYDKTIELWDASSGQHLRALEGHTGAVYDVAFSPDSRFLVSSSADDTCKLWRVEDGLRMDTFPQPLKAEYTCVFSPDGRSIVAGGADNNIRVWQFISRDKPEVNPMVVARFAHEGAVVRLAFTPDGSKLVSLGEDRTVKVWSTNDYTELQLWENQSDVPTALAIAGNGSTVRVGRMDGSLAAYDLNVSQPADTVSAQAPPEHASAAPEGKVTRISESEPNDIPAQANPVTLPVEIAGTIAGSTAGPVDFDLFRFSAKAGQPWVVEVNADRTKTRLDSFVEILDHEGRRVPRVILQATRDSYLSFQGKDDRITDDFRVFNWEEMQLNEYLYVNGEIV
jgi:WD40 repeat protein